MGFAPPPHDGFAFIASAHTDAHTLLRTHHTLPPSPTQRPLEALFGHMDDALWCIWGRRVRG
jgi:hypothetical protein